MIKTTIDFNRAVSALRKIQQEPLTPDQIKGVVDEALNDTAEQRMIGSTTNSPIGCQHWFNILVGDMAHIGDFMREREITDQQRVEWGKRLSENARILIENYDKIPFKW